MTKLDWQLRVAHNPCYTWPHDEADYQAALGGRRGRALEIDFERPTAHVMALPRGQEISAAPAAPQSAAVVPSRFAHIGAHNSSHNKLVVAHAQQMINRFVHRASTGFILPEGALRLREPPALQRAPFSLPNPATQGGNSGHFAAAAAAPGDSILPFQGALSQQPAHHGAFGELGARFFLWDETPQGVWVLLHFPTLVASVEITIRGISESGNVRLAQGIPIKNTPASIYNIGSPGVNPQVRAVRAELLTDRLERHSNARRSHTSARRPPPPPRLLPSQEHELRFIRHSEYYAPLNERNDGNCAPITASGSPAALRGDTVHVSQKMLSGRVFCAFDLLLWVPRDDLPVNEASPYHSLSRRLSTSGDADCSLQIAAGSTAMGFLGGLVQGASACVGLLGVASSPPPPPTPPEPSSDSDEPDLTPAVALGGAALGGAALVAVGGAVFGFYWYKGYDARHTAFHKKQALDLKESTSASLHYSRLPNLHLAPF